MSGFVLWAREVICGIYKIESPTGKIYIGQAVDIYKRWVSHKNGKKITKLKSSLISHGIENHTFEIVERCNECLLDEREDFWSKFYDCVNTPHGLCIKEAGSNGRHSEETKAKMRQSALGKIISDESKEKNKQAHLGKTHTRETKDKLSEMFKGREFTPEWKEKISKANKGRDGWNKGKTNVYSEETLIKMSNAAKGRVISDDHLIKLRIAFDNLEKIPCKYCDKSMIIQNHRRHEPICEMKSKQLFLF